MTDKTGGIKIKITDIFKKLAGPSPAVPGQRFERKFYIIPRNTGFAYTLLRQVCRPDPEFPSDIVHSLYFDTVDLEQYERSASGEFRKDKVRIRWYGDSPPAGEVPVFIELKSRQGFASSKQRRRLLVPASQLEPAQLFNGIVSKTVLSETLAGFAHFPEKPLRPVILINYRRYRFYEILTGERVSFDLNICASVIDPQLGGRPTATGEIALTGGVVEVKGPALTLPLTLRRMKFLDVDWSRFSKYGTCLDVYFDTPGSVGRLSPSGKLISI
jgi:hypothetical protein